jgi:transposase InsO family protein
MSTYCEGFFGRLKNEMFYNRSWQGVSIEQFINELDSYLRWYNEKRIKISLGAMSPMDYRRSIGLIAWKSPEKCPHPLWYNFRVALTSINGKSHL